MPYADRKEGNERAQEVKMGKNGRRCWYNSGYIPRMQRNEELKAISARGVTPSPHLVSKGNKVTANKTIRVLVYWSGV